jgi:hypothetical protein
MARMILIFAFDHKHHIGDICSRRQCEHARRAPVLAGAEVLEDMPMRILRKATRKEYLSQSVPDGWCIPALEYGCEHIYEVQTL